MSGILEYKGYFGTVECSTADNVLFGKVLGITGLISYEGETIPAIKQDFEEAIDEYLEDCKESGIEPQKAYKGKFNVRVAPDLHKKLAIYAASHGQTLNATVEKAIERYVVG